MNTTLQKLMDTMGPLYKFEGTDVPLHHNTAGLSKSIDFETGLLLSNFVQWKKPETIVELGTFRGYSTAWLILGSQLAGTHMLPCGHVHAFEVFKEGSYGSMWYDDLEMRLENFTYHEVPKGIWNFPEEIPAAIDFIFHDTQHSLNPTIQEMNILLPRVPVGGMVLVDDMLYPDYKPMQGYLNRLFTTSELGVWKWTVLPIGHGLGIAERLK